MIELGLMLAFAGVILLFTGAGQLLQNRAFENAQRVTGTVVSKHSRNLKNGRAYLLKLSYSVDGIAYEREVSVLKTEYDALEPGAQFEVQYRPSKPNKILHVHATDPKPAKTVLLIAVVLLVVGVALFFIGRL